jgi:hypothetical protein
MLFEGFELLAKSLLQLKLLKLFKPLKQHQTPQTPFETHGLAAPAGVAFFIFK